MNAVRGRLGLPWIVVLVLLIAVGCVAGLSASASGESTQTSAAGDARGADRVSGEELTDLRTRTSRTFVGRDGANVTHLYSQSVNYKAGGDWRPIDDTLSASTVPGYALKNGANRFDLELPSQLSAHPVRVVNGDQWVSFEMAGGSGAPAATGETATYADAAPGVDAEYTAEPDSVKESLKLSNAQAPSDFSFKLDSSSGLSPRETDAGGIEFVNGDGDASFSFDPPSMQDAGGARSAKVSLELHHAEDGGYVAKLSADRDWIESPDRNFPVTIDPTTQVIGNGEDCYMVGGTLATSHFCGFAANTLDVGAGSVPGNPRRTFLKFDMSAIPTEAVILNADLALYANDGASRQVMVHHLTQDSTSSRTWNTSDGTNAWTAPSGGTGPGGAIGSTPDATATAGGTAGWYHWYPTALVQGWVNKSISNYGAVLKENETGTPPNTVLHFRSTEQTGSEPYLSVRWDEPTGIKPSYKFQDVSLDDRMGLKANIANGNLMLVENDLHIAGTNGMDEDFTRVFNSNSYWGNELTGSFSSDSAEPFIENYGSQANVVVWMPGFTPQVFTKQADGTFSPPGGFDASLTYTSGVGYTLSFKHSGAKWTFSDGGSLINQKDRNGNTISFVQDANHVIKSITDTQGRVTNFTLNASGYLDHVIDSSSRRWDYAYTGNFLTSFTNPEGKVTSYGYTSGGALRDVTDPRGNLTHMTYDSQFRVKTIQRYTDTAHTVGPTWTFTYGTASAPCDVATSGGKTVVTDPNGHDTTYCWDAQQRVTSAFDANSKRHDSTYDANSNIKNLTEPGQANGTAFTYDTAGSDPSNNPTGGTTATGGSFSQTYTPATQKYLPTGSSDTSGRSLAYDYDGGTAGGAGNLTSVKDGQSPTTIKATLTYNSDGTIKTAADGNNHTTTYTYTGGNLTKITPPVVGSGTQIGATVIGPDSLSRTHTVQDGQLQTRTYTYDKLDRVTRIDYADGSYVAETYDENGNEATRTNGTAGGSSTITYTYDKLNRLTGQTGPRSTTYGYDAAGNLTSLVDSGGTITYGYDVLNQLHTLTEPVEGTTTPQTVFGYNDRSDRTSTAYPNGVSITDTYDEADKPLTVTNAHGATTLSHMTYTYDDASSPVKHTEQVQTLTDNQSGNVTTYTYDPKIGRLQEAKTKTGAGAAVDDYLYGYDNASNLNSKSYTVGSGSPTTTTYSFNEDNELTTTGGHTLNYDANGNETLDQSGRAFAYNAQDQTKSITPSGGSLASLTYEGTGQDELTGIGGTSLFPNALGVGSITSGANTYYYRRGSDGGLVGAKNPAGRYYYLFDGQGSVIGLTDSTGTQVNTYKYEPYGRITSSTGSTYNPFKYVSGLTLGAGTDLYHFGARYYDPELARWTQQDPIAQTGDLKEGNRYDYAGDDPVNAADPSGRRPGNYCPPTGTSIVGRGQAEHCDYATGHGIRRSTLTCHDLATAGGGVAGGLLGGAAGSAIGPEGSAAGGRVGNAIGAGIGRLVGGSFC